MAALTEPFIIVAGFDKCGSTSLFRYLSDHPQVCEPIDKDVGYFLDPVAYQNLQHQTPWMGKHKSTEPEFYLTAFQYSHAHKYRIEACAAYARFPHTIETILKPLHKAALIFVLRHPDTLDSGHYARLLKPYWDGTTVKRAALIGFEQLKSNPKTVLDELCNTLDLDPGFYLNYRFTTHNKTMGFRSPAIDAIQSAIVSKLRKPLLKHPRLFNMVSYINEKTWQRFYESVNATSAQSVEVLPEDKEFLASYYSCAAQELLELTGHKDLF